MNKIKLRKDERACGGCGVVIRKSYSLIFPICKDCIKIQGLSVMERPVWRRRL